MKNSLLVIPKEDNAIHREAMIPPGIAYINGALRAAEIPVIGMNLNFLPGEVNQLIWQAVRKYDVAYILCGGTTANIGGILECFCAARQANPHIVCIGGGAGFTAEPELFCRMTTADIAVLGEGEVTDVELLRTLDNGESLSQVEGIIYWDGEQYIKTPERHVIQNLDQLPFPSYADLGIEDYFENEKSYENSALFDYSYTEAPRVLPMFLGRSCPFGCKFCFHTTGRRYRVRSLDNFFAELDHWIALYQINGVLLMDELFGGKESVIVEFCRRIKPYQLPWVAEIRVELATPRVLRALKDANCNYLQLGLESMSSYVLQDMNKRISPLAIETALKTAYDLGIHVFGNFIFGAEQEDWNSFLTTYNWWNRHRHYQIKLLNILTYPNSVYYQNALKRGLITDKEQFIWEGMPLINLSKLNEYQWDKMRRVLRMTYTDGIFKAKILQIKEENDQINLILRCSHCGQNFTKCGIDQRRRNENTDMIALCPHCQRTNHYNFDDFSGIMTHELMSQWVQNSLEQFDYTWCQRQGYQRVALWGDENVLAELIIKQFGEQVELAAITGRNLISEYGFVGRHVAVISPEKLFDLEIDALIILNPAAYQQESDFLRESGYTGRLDSIVNLVFDMEYHLLLDDLQQLEDFYR